MGDGNLSPEFIRGVERTLVQFQNQGFDGFTKALQRLVEGHGQSHVFGLPDKYAFRSRALSLYRSWRMVEKAKFRMDQLSAAGFNFWVYRSNGEWDCPPEHLELDGIALSPKHPFWSAYFPPNTLCCACSVFGARTEAGIVRVGGDLHKVLPIWWSQSEGSVGRLGIESGYLGLDFPGLRRLVAKSIRR